MMFFIYLLIANLISFSTAVLLDIPVTNVYTFLSFNLTILMVVGFISFVSNVLQVQKEEKNNDNK